MDPEEQLKRIVKDTGEVNSVYGGFEIKVSKPALFPWYKIFNQLIDIDQEVWLNKVEGKINITSKPRAR
jgi:hypothetical protein